MDATVAVKSPARPTPAPSRTMVTSRPVTEWSGSSTFPLKRRTQTFHNEPPQVLKAGLARSARWSAVAPISQARVIAPMILAIWWRFQVARNDRTASNRGPGRKTRTRVFRLTFLNLLGLGMGLPGSGRSDRGRRPRPIGPGADDQGDRGRAVFGPGRLGPADGEEGPFHRLDPGLGIEEDASLGLLLGHEHAVQPDVQDPDPAREVADVDRDPTREGRAPLDRQGHLDPLPRPDLDVIGPEGD